MASGKVRKFVQDIYHFLIKPVVSTLDTDSQLGEIRNFDHIDAKNISFVAQDRNQGTAVLPAIGDVYAYNVPSVTAQNKIYRVDIDCSAEVVDARVQVYDTNGNQVEADIMFTITSDDTAATYTAFTDSFNSWNGTIANPYTIAYTQSASGTLLSVTVEFTDVTGYEWTMLSLNDEVVCHIIQEAIDASLVGNSNIIFSKEDVYKNVFIWSTPCTHLPTKSDISIVGVGDNGDGIIQITVDDTSGLVDGMSIVLKGATGVDAASINGTWIIDLLDGTHFDLMHSTYTGNTFTRIADIYLYVGGYGKIGVAVKNINTNIWTYYDLLRSRELNFRRPWQIDGVLQIDNLGWNLKWNDDNNVDRVFYYDTEEEFILDGAITALHSLGKYSYGLIGEETSLILNIDVGKLSFTGQTVGGGAVGSGNWRYGVRGVAANGREASQTTYMDVLVPVYQANQNLGGASYLNLCGDDSTQADIPSGKINNFLLTDIPVGVYQYVELVATQYIGLSERSFVITRQLLPVDADSMELQHTGSETDTIILASAELSVINDTPLISRNMRLIQNRLVRSNLKQGSVYDFSEHAQSVTWNVRRKQLQGIGLGSGKETGDYIYYGEYLVPENVCNYVGYMINETYRFGFEYHIKGQGWTNAYFSKDVKIDVIAAGLSYDLTTDATDDTQIWSYYVEPSNINLNYIIDGVVLRDVVDRIRVVRVAMDESNREVLGSGLMAMSMEHEIYSPNGSGTDYIGEYGTWLMNWNQPYPYIRTPNLRYATMYYSDAIWGGSYISYTAGDQIINFGAPNINYYELHQTPDIQSNNMLYEFNGYTNQTDNGNVQIIDIADMELLLSGNVAYHWNDLVLSYSKLVTDTTVGTNVLKQPTAPILFFNDDIIDGNQAGNTNYGYLQVQYFRPKTNKFGNSIYGNTYISTGCVYDITASSPAIIGTGVMQVFGGDVFTQKCYLRDGSSYEVTNGAGGWKSGFSGANLGIAWYGQNYINQQMRFEGSPSGLLFPLCHMGTWMNTVELEPLNYQQGYTPRQIDQTSPAYDPNNPIVQELPTRISYSLSKANDSLVDSNRIFLPLNFYDLDLSDGEINHMELFNGELITYQTKAMRHPYFNTTGKFEIGDAGAIVTGDGGIMTRTPATPTKYGLSNKWAFAKGLSENGDDVHYWVDTYKGKVFRFAGDGVRCISDVNKCSNWFANNLRFAAGQDTPADNQGINMIWDERRREAVIIVRAWKDVADWVEDTEYVIGENAIYGTFGFNEIPQIWVSKTNGNTTTPSEGADWERIDGDNNEYYNLWSMAYSETRNKGFTDFYSPLPKICLPYADHYLMPSPVGDTGNVYEAWVLANNNYCQWFGGDLVEDGYIEFVCNYLPQIEKNYISFVANCSITPYKVEVFTESMHTIINRADIIANGKQNLDQWFFPLLKDIDGGGRMMGKFARIKFYFHYGEFQMLNDITTKFSVKPRPISS